MLLSEAGVVEPGFWDLINRWSVTSLAGVPYTYQEGCPAWTGPTRALASRAVDRGVPIGETLSFGR